MEEKRVRLERKGERKGRSRKKEKEKKNYICDAYTFPVLNTIVATKKIFLTLFSIGNLFQNISFIQNFVFHFSSY